MSQSNVSECRLAFTISIPIILAYVPIGLVFGVLCVQSGVPWWLATFMSAVVYSGAAQFVALSMFTEHAAWLSIVVTVFFIAFRNSFYGLSFLKRYNQHWLIKTVLALLLVDATYALLLSHPTRDGHSNTRFCLWTSIWVWSYWTGGTLLGAIFSRWIPPFDAFQFVLPAFFMAVAVDYWVKLKSWHVIVMPIVASLLAYWLMPSRYLLVAIVISVVAIIVFDRASQRKLRGATGVK